MVCRQYLTEPRAQDVAPAPPADGGVAAYHHAIGERQHHLVVDGHAFELCCQHRVRCALWRPGLDAAGEGGGTRLVICMRRGGGAASTAWRRGTTAGLGFSEGAGAVGRGGGTFAGQRADLAKVFCHALLPSCLLPSLGCAPTYVGLVGEPPASAPRTQEAEHGTRAYLHAPEDVLALSE